jgi:hypothetical protein
LGQSSFSSLFTLLVTATAVMLNASTLGTATAFDFGLMEFMATLSVLVREKLHVTG